MNIKIQGGGGGTYGNSGSCFGAVSYLKHEDAQRAEQGQQVEPFFNQEKNVNSKEVITQIDANKAKLCKDDAKFFMITISPSQQEIQAMGKTSEEQSQNLKEYIRDDVMKNYAENFNKGLSKDDVKYYAKIHHGRGENTENQMHVHIIVSRKDMSNTKKISPQTNHRFAEKSGTVKSAFNKSAFYNKCEGSFDNKFNYSRNYRESFEYQNTIKNGTLQEKQDVIRKNVASERTKANEQEMKLEKEKRPLLEKNQEEKERKQNKNRGLSI